METPDTEREDTTPEAESPDEAASATTPAVPRDLWPFIALESATLIAGVGNGVATVALPWLTLQLTNDPAAAGVVVAAGAVPTLFASLASGVIIDRLGRRRTSVGSDVFSATSAAMIPLFSLLGILTYPLVLIASALGAVFDAVGVTARESLLPDVAARTRLPLERVNGVHEASWGLAYLIGPGIAGLLIGAIGADNSFWTMFAGFAVSAVLVGTAKMPRPPARTGEPQHWIADALDGLRFVLRDPAIRATTVLSTISFTLAYSVIAVVLPVIFERQDMPEALGLLFVVYSAGGIVGALGYSALASRVPRRAGFVIGLLATVPVAGVFAFPTSYPVQVVALALAGFLAGAVGPISNVVLQERTAEQMRGRVLSVVFSFAYAIFPIGYVASGFMIREVGIAETAAAAALISAVVAIWAMFTPALREMYAPPPV